MFQINGDLDLSIISNLSFWGCLWGILSLKTLIWSQGHFHAWVKVWASITQKRNALFPETHNSAKSFKTCLVCACIFLFKILSDNWSILFILKNWRLQWYFGGYLVADSWESEKVLVSLALQLVCAAVVAFNKIKVAYMAYVKALLSLPHTFDKKAKKSMCWWDEIKIVKALMSLPHFGENLGF